MANTRVGYRLRLYAARSVDPTEATILTPAPGADHADEFKVATVADEAGYKPYLQDELPGRRGRINLKSRKLDVGTLTALLIDKQLESGSNLKRWWTSFFGNAAGKPMPRNKVEIDECLDLSASPRTWTLYGRYELVGQGLVEKNQARLSLCERSETLKMKCFVGTPHSSIGYVAKQTLLPVGISGADYGDAQMTDPFTGTTSYQLIAGSNYAALGEIMVHLDRTSIGHERNILTRNLAQAIAPHGTIDVLDPMSTTGQPRVAWVPNFSGKARARIKQTSGGGAGTEGDYRVGGLFTRFERVPDGRQHQRIAGFFIKALEATDAGYAAIPAAAGISVEASIYVEEEVSPTRPLLLDDVDPVTLLEDLCAGKFGPIYRQPQKLPAGKAYGDVERSVPTNAASFNAVRGVWPTQRFIVTKPEPLIDWAEKNILLPNCLHWFVNRAGEVCLIDLRLPTSLGGIPTLTDVDVDETEDVDWQYDPTPAVRRVDITRYTERIRAPAELWASTDITPSIEEGGAFIEETAFPMESIWIGSSDYGDESLKIDARGYRSMEGERHSTGNQSRSSYLDSTLEQLAVEVQNPLGYGLITAPLHCRRTATVTGLAQGSLVIADVDVLPDPATWRRGGPMLCRVLEYSEDDGPGARLLLAYLSSTSPVGAPTLAAPAQETGNTYTGVTVAVTLNAGGWPVVVRYAITDTGVGSAPADDSPLWRIAKNAIGRGVILFENQAARIRGLPPGKRIWIQGRSQPHLDTLRPPSAWTAAAAPGYVDTAALPAPSALSVVASDRVATLSWTNGATDLVVEVLLATPVGDPRRRVAIAHPGTTQWKIRDLTPGTQYRAEVRHALGQDPGAGDTEDFTMAAASTTAPTPRSIDVVPAILPG